MGKAPGNTLTSNSLQRSVTTLNDFADSGIAYFHQVLFQQRQISPACQAGCAYCCHGPVHPTPVEVLNIVHYINSSAISPDQRADLRQRMHERRIVIGKLTVSEQLLQTIPCPFLLTGRCGIYAVRPLCCRGRNVLDAAPCIAGFKDPTRQQQYEIIQEQTLISQCLAFSILDALQKRGLPYQFVDLSQATMLAFDTPDLIDRWLGGDNLLAEAELRPHSAG